jgi:hypothetical protein
VKTTAGKIRPHLLILPLAAYILRIHEDTPSPETLRRNNLSEEFPVARPNPWFTTLAVVLAAALSGCSKSATKTIDEAISLPIRGVRAGVRQIGKGVKRVKKARDTIINCLLMDRNRAQIVREHRETRAHLEKVRDIISVRRIKLGRSEIRLLRDAGDLLENVRRLLETKRIPAQAGLTMYRQLDDVRQSLTLIRRQHNTPRYSGFIAIR